MRYRSGKFVVGYEPISGIIGSLNDMRTASAGENGTGAHRAWMPRRADRRSDRKEKLSMNIVQTIATELGIQTWQVEAVVKLIDEGNTIPFIARYRKEAHGTLDDEQLRNLDERLRYLRALEERRAAILASIEEQGKLTPALKKQIEEAATQSALEDLYLPYRPKRRTRATIAKERGLEPLAQEILSQEMKVPALERAADFVEPEKDVKDAAAALQGAEDIIAEQISDSAQIRAQIRERTFETGVIVSEVKKDMEQPESVYAQYFHYEEAASKIPGHRVLALNRGEKEKVLGIAVRVDEDEMIGLIGRNVIRSDDPNTLQPLKDTCADAYRRLIAPAIERELRNSLTEKAEDGAIDVFGKNLRQLLMQPPIAGQVVLGWDPAFRTGCKIAVVDSTGKVLDTTVVYPTAPTTPAKIEAAKQTIKRLIAKYHVTLISCGNGTASRESEQVIAEILSEVNASGHAPKVHYVIVNEAGASVYSASKLATEEFPQFDVGQRSAASIARRLQDPLSELVKIDPKSIGVGQYQHDCDQKKLGEKLEGVVETCVNQVGVDLNTASYSLLEYVSGITKKTARSIGDWRNENGRFTDRRQLLKVAGLGPKAFQQCAGFLRIRGGRNPLDMTGVHPESYEAAGKLLEKLGYGPEDVEGGKISGLSAQMKDRRKAEETAQELGCGTETLIDLAAELEKPGRDPRSEMPRPVLRSDVLAMEDLKPGMILKGTVRNVIDFGAFVDIGVHQDGLVHVSQMSDTRFVKHPLDVVSVGDIVEVKVLAVDLDRKRISLTMKLGEKAEQPSGKDERRGSQGGRDHADARGRSGGAGSRNGGSGDRNRDGNRAGERSADRNRSGGAGDRNGGNGRKDRDGNGSADHGRRVRGNAGGLDMSALLKKWS